MLATWSSHELQESNPGPRPTGPPARPVGRPLVVRTRWVGGKLIATLLLLLAASTVAIAQTEPTLRVVEDPDRRELVIELGPFDFPAHATHHDVVQPEALRSTIPVSGWIHGFEVEIVDGEGRAVPQRVLHHVNVISPDQRELFSQIMLRIAAAGQETAPAVLPRLVGYRVQEGQALLVTAAFHNPTPDAYRGVVLRVRMPYTPEATWLRPISAFPFYMDVMPPASVHSYDLPPGRSERSWSASPAIDGRILGVGGHLHKYGVALRLEDLTAGEVLWEAEPILDEEGEVEGMPIKRFFWTLGVPLRHDHVYRLTAVYDNPTGRTIPDGAMGALGGLFVPAPGQAWPVADPDHPEYALDVEIVTSGAYGHGGHNMAASNDAGGVEGPAPPGQEDGRRHH